MPQTPDSNSDANGVSPPSSESPLAPTSGTPTMQPASSEQPTGPISYWQMKLCAEQPPDFVGTADELDEWVKSNPPVDGMGRLEMDGRSVILIRQETINRLSRDMANHFLRGTEPEAPEPAPSLIDHVRDYAALFDTSMPFYEMQKRAQRATTKTPAPSIPGSSRAQRRDSGDRRTVKQIMADQRREGR